MLYHEFLELLDRRFVQQQFLSKHTPYKKASDPKGRYIVVGFKDRRYTCFDFLPGVTKENPFGNYTEGSVCSYDPSEMPDIAAELELITAEDRDELNEFFKRILRKDKNE